MSEQAETSQQSPQGGQQQQQQQQGPQGGQNPQAGGNYPTASLYVGDLEPNVTESMLFEIFKKVGTVASIRVCRDAATRRSLGYAYVNFHNVSDAERALEVLNYAPIAGRACRIMWSHRDPSLRRSGKGNIFIKNLDEGIDNKALYDTFSAFGNILSCKVSMDKDGNSKGFGFVHYEKAESADAAIQNVNGMLLLGKVVYVGPFVAGKQRSGPGGEIRFTNCYVKDLPLDASEEEVRALFAKYGEITSLIVMKDENQKSRGFGFINYSEPEAARQAVEELHGNEFKGKKLYVSRAQKKQERENQLKRQFEERKLRYQESNLYVKNLEENIDTDKLKTEFAPFGTIISAKVMSDDNGRSKGFGFVCFSNQEEAMKAVQELNGQMLGGKPLYVALAQRREVRTAQLQAQYAHRMNAGRGIALPNPYMTAPNNFPLVAQGRPFVTPYGPTAGGGVMVRPPRGWPQQQGAGRGYPPNVAYAAVGRAPPQQQQQQGGRQPHQQQQQQQQQQGGRGQQGPPPNQQQVIINKNAANKQQQGAGAQQQQQQGEKKGQSGATQPSLADLSEKERKQVLGEFLYPKIEKLLTEIEGNPSETGKITGMLLESLDHTELLHLLESPAELKNRVSEAIIVLREHMAAAEGEKN